MHSPRLGHVWELNPVIVGEHVLYCLSLVQIPLFSPFFCLEVVDEASAWAEDPSRDKDVGFVEKTGAAVIENSGGTLGHEGEISLKWDK